jgi:hypothetical protein
MVGYIPDGYVAETPSIRDIPHPKWVNNMINVDGIDVGDATNLRKNRSKKQRGNLALMVHVLESCDKKHM